MIYPPIDKILPSFDSKYTIVILAAKRARQIRAGSSPLVEAKGARNDVTIALQEIADGKLTFERIKNGIK
ncbi:MAG: DNA-directed RNA polymerase subunit omega [Firmicutes bacterium]|jgi:DNA-directed RNA polymerase subunit omega|nr:DNA-directed RNA polymerase subunit omega [Bacillota bacterium]